jgi:multiple sugar transport system substrate-binding protein
MKKLFALMFIALSVVALVGCKKDPVELVIYSDFAREVAEKETYRNEIFEAFEKENNVIIRFETLAQAEDTFNKVDSEQKAGNHTIDLLISHYGTMEDYISAGYMENVSALEDELDDRTFLSAFDGSTVSNGNRYFFPINSDVYLSYANKSAFDTLPTGLTKADILAGNYTWEDYAAWAAAIGGNSTMLKGEPLKQLLYQVGGMALSNGGTFPNLNDAGNLKAWQDIISMKANIHPESATTLDSSAMMASGSVVLAFDLMTPIANAVNAAPARYEVFPGPQGSSGKAGSIAGGHGIGIVKNAPHKELAEKFIEWFTAPEQIIYAALGTIPTLAEATAELSDDPSDIVIKQGLETLKNANVEGLQMISEFSSWSSVKETYDRIFSGIMSGTITLDNLQSKLDEEQAILTGLRN